ncbi:hypothetical protein LEMLEM_LOCUS16719 [Lemmus lemmus]
MKKSQHNEKQFVFRLQYVKPEAQGGRQEAEEEPGFKFKASVLSSQPGNGSVIITFSVFPPPDKSHIERVGKESMPAKAGGENESRLQEDESHEQKTKAVCRSFHFLVPPSSL